MSTDLIAWLQLHALDGELAKAEPKRLRYRILHNAARLVRGNAAAGYAYRPAGPGPTRSPPRSHGSRPSPSPAAPAQPRPNDRKTQETTPTARAQARTAVAGFIDEYNNDGRHSSAGRLPPVVYEAQARAARAA